MKEVLKADIHVIYYKEEDSYIIGSPELDTFTDALISKESFNETEERAYILDKFIDVFKVKKKRYENMDHFISNMQRLNNWIFEPKTKIYKPNTFDYYVQNYKSVEKMVSKKNANILKTAINIALNTEDIEFV